MLGWCKCILTYWLLLVLPSYEWKTYSDVFPRNFQHHTCAYRCFTPKILNTKIFNGNKSQVRQTSQVLQIGCWHKIQVTLVFLSWVRGHWVHLTRFCKVHSTPLCMGLFKFLDIFCLKSRGKRVFTNLSKWSLTSWRAKSFIYWNLVFSISAETWIYYVRINWKNVQNCIKMVRGHLRLRSFVEYTAGFSSSASTLHFWQVVQHSPYIYFFNKMILYSYP